MNPENAELNPRVPVYRNKPYRGNNQHTIGIIVSYAAITPTTAFVYLAPYCVAAVCEYLEPGSVSKEETLSASGV